MKLKIDRTAWQKIQAFVDNCEYEIGGLGQVVCDGEDFLVTDVTIFHQKVTAAHVDLTSETLAKFQSERVKAKESMKNYKFWWHSHAKMDAFFSGTDTNTIDQSGAEFPWLVSFVTNHAHKLVARLDIYQPVHVTCPLAVEIYDAGDQTIIDACKAEIAEKVTMPTKPSYYNRGGFYGQTHHHHDRGGFYGLDFEDDLPTPTKKQQKKREKLERDMEAKERVLRHLEAQPETKRRNSMIARLEQEIADISLELDKFDLPTTPTLPTPGNHLPYQHLLD